MTCTRGDSSGLLFAARGQARLERSVSCWNSSISSGVNVGFPLSIAARKSRVVASCNICSNARARMPAGRRCARPLDVGRREEVARGCERAEVDLLVGHRADVARPDLRPPLTVGRADGEDEVEAAPAEERRVEPGDSVRDAGEQMVGCLAHARDLF